VHIVEWLPRCYILFKIYHVFVFIIAWAKMLTCICHFAALEILSYEYCDAFFFVGLAVLVLVDVREACL